MKLNLLNTFQKSLLCTMLCTVPVLGWANCPSFDEICGPNQQAVIKPWPSNLIPNHGCPAPATFRTCISVVNDKPDCPVSVTQCPDGQFIGSRDVHPELVRAGCSAKVQVCKYVKPGFLPENLESYIISFDLYQRARNDGLTRDEVTGKPSVDELMNATGLDEGTALSILQAPVGVQGGEDLRNWHAIMASPDPLKAVRQASRELITNPEIAEFRAGYNKNAGYPSFSDFISKYNFKVISEYNGFKIVQKERGELGVYYVNSADGWIYPKLVDTEIKKFFIATGLDASDLKLALDQALDNEHNPAVRDKFNTLKRWVTEAESHTANAAHQAGATKASDANIQGFYQQELGRAASEGEIKAWQETGKTRDDIRLGIQASQEALNHKAASFGGTVSDAQRTQIQQDYQQHLGRAASDAEIRAWMATGQSAEGITQGIKNSNEARSRKP